MSVERGEFYCLVGSLSAIKARGCGSCMRSSLEYIMVAGVEGGGSSFTSGKGLQHIE